MIMPILKFFLRDSTLKYGGCYTESICQDNPDVAAHAKSKEIETRLCLFAKNLVSRLRNTRQSTRECHYQELSMGSPPGRG